MTTLSLPGGQMLEVRSDELALLGEWPRHYHAKVATNGIDLQQAPVNDLLRLAQARHFLQPAPIWDRIIRALSPRIFYMQPMPWRTVEVFPDGSCSLSLDAQNRSARWTGTLSEQASNRIDALVDAAPNVPVPPFALMGSEHRFFVMRRDDMIALDANEYYLREHYGEILDMLQRWIAQTNGVPDGTHLELR